MMQAVLALEALKYPKQQLNANNVVELSTMTFEDLMALVSNEEMALAA